MDTDVVATAASLQLAAFAAGEQATREKRLDRSTLNVLPDKPELWILDGLHHSPLRLSWLLSIQAL